LMDSQRQWFSTKIVFLFFTFKLNEHTQERRAIERNLTSGKLVTQARSVHENTPFTRVKFHTHTIRERTTLGEHTATAGPATTRALLPLAVLSTWTMDRHVEVKQN